MDITKILTDELINDLNETYEDIMYCESALKLNIKAYYSGGSVRKRLESNQRIKETIEAELKLRGRKDGL